MPTFEVTTALTAYTTYIVEAADAGAARERVQNENRSEMIYREAGYGDEEEVVSVRQVGTYLTRRNT